MLFHRVVFDRVRCRGGDREYSKLGSVVKSVAVDSLLERYAFGYNHEVLGCGEDRSA